ncbi:mitochondrial 2-oxodicarboxylate carrier [Copidosoma floridanum]|uniref:mitochondrial 2-oxodicarboxylate carrier n=1 Tax=Copidosoma floridanum TaxID=29053 RepID=UPI0006C960C2|nr:mitochondrial 2-oxodicarboxylate carrier [Copidosoma floridanum]XP_023246549.1 mitochondrial 2-oxodicarboxylate carrier [Copidosoma floridanum]XP_023246550.1 mitochondrial 2-oxodicarboxylate carrier [Copidosoma floridanum]
MANKEAQPSKKRSWAKEAAIQIGSGGSAGFVEVCIMHPMDLVKTRLQLQVKTKGSDPTYYTGIGDCLKKMYRNEGFFSYWKGIVPPILVETPKRAVKFFTFEQYKQLFLFGASAPTPLTFSCAGLCAGFTEGFLVNPFEVIKVQLQSNRKHVKDSPSTMAITKEIIRKHGFGLNGLNKGLTATLLRNGIFNGFYFGFYHSVKSSVPSNPNSTYEFLTKVAIGFCSGSFASCLNIPFDVAKSRIQGPEGHKYKGTLRTIAIVYKAEGFRALYKGLVPKVVRLGPGGAIMLVVYDYMHEYLVSVLN